MATKNCPKCDSPNPVACKKCACGHVFFATRRSANTLAAESAEDISEPTTPQEPEVPRRRTARVTRERPQFYDALQVENQTRRQRELQKRRKASKSDDVETVEEVVEKPAAVAITAKRRAESPPSKVYEQPAKKRRGRPPGLSTRKPGRAQIMANKPVTDTGKVDGAGAVLEDELENLTSMHDVPPMKALQMNLVLADINSRISSSSVKAEVNLPPVVAPDAVDKEGDLAEIKSEPMDCDGSTETVVKKDSPIKKEPGDQQAEPEPVQVPTGRGGRRKRGVKEVEVKVEKQEEEEKDVPEKVSPKKDSADAVQSEEKDTVGVTPTEDSKEKGEAAKEEEVGNVEAEIKSDAKAEDKVVEEDIKPDAAKDNANAEDEKKLDESKVEVKADPIKDEPEPAALETTDEDTTEKPNSKENEVVAEITSDVEMKEVTEKEPEKEDKPEEPISESNSSAISAS